WTGSAEATALVDPMTTRATFTGNVGDLYQWEAQLAYDDVQRTLYAIGENRAGIKKLYTVSLDTQKSSSVPLDITGEDGGVINYVVAKGTDDGKLVAAYWDGAAETVALIDPQTGRSVREGRLGDLYQWQGEIVYYAADNLVYAIGEDRAGAQH